MTTQPQTERTTLAGWLLEQIAEDKRVAREVADDFDRDEYAHNAWGFYANNADSNGDPIVAVGPARVLADCEAKRKIVGLYAHACRQCEAAEEFGSFGQFKWAEWAQVLGIVARRLAQPYHDRPGWREEWAE